MKCRCKTGHQFIYRDELGLPPLIVVPSEREETICDYEATKTFEWMCSKEHAQITSLCDFHAEAFSIKIKSGQWACRWCLPVANINLMCRELPLVDA